MNGPATPEKDGKWAKAPVRSPPVPHGKTGGEMLPPIIPGGETEKAMGETF